MVLCFICNENFNNYKKLSAHLKIHKISSKEYYDKYLKKENEGICLMFGHIPSCNKNTKFTGLINRYKKFCSTKCSSSNFYVKEKSKKTCQLRYGVDFTGQYESKNSNKRKKLKENATKNYSFKNFKNHIDLLKNDNEYKNFIFKKIKRTINNKIKENSNFYNEINNKRLNTINNKYTKDEISKSIVDGRLKISIKKLNKILKYLNLELLSDYKKAQSNIQIRCKICGTIFETNYFNLRRECGKCPDCYPHYKSNQEIEILEFIKSIEFSEMNECPIIENDRNIINPYELDIFIPSKNIAIEFDGLYWHSENQGKDKNYHLNKTELCQSKNIRLIHIFEDEWIFKNDIVKSRLRQILGLNNSEKIYARKCEIREISPKIKNLFLNKYHIQGEDKSNIKLGAFYQDELISVMTFSKGNISKGSKNIENVWELNRFCSNNNYHIPGIASKILSYFKKNYEWKEIFSYADRRWSDGNLYIKIGFKLDSITKPNYFYIKGLNRIHRFNLRKKYHEPKDIPEWVLRLQEGYHKIWDCGHYKFKMENYE